MLKTTKVEGVKNQKLSIEGDKIGYSEIRVEVLSNLDEIGEKNEIYKKGIEIIDYFLNLDSKKLKHGIWINKKLGVIGFYGNGYLNHVDFSYYSGNTRMISRNLETGKLSNLGNTIVKTYRYLYDTEKAGKSPIKMEQDFNKYDLEFLEFIKKYQLGEIDYTNVPSYDEYLELEGLKIKKNQAGRSMSYEKALSICKNNNTRIPTKNELLKLFKVPNIMEELKITNSSIWCKDENGDLLIAGFKSKSFHSTNTENKLYLLEISN